MASSRKPKKTNGADALNRARIALSQKNGIAARDAAREVLANDPENTEAQSHLALVEYAAGDESALKRLEFAAHAAPPEGFFEHYNLGTIYMGLDRFADADTELSAAVVAQPGNPMSLLDLGRVKMALGDGAAAAKVLKPVAAAMPDEWVVQSVYARALIMARRLPDAYEVLEQSVRSFPEAITLHEDLFKLALLSGQPQLAVRVAVGLREQIPESSKGPYLQGFALLAMGKPAEALDPLEQALVLSPTAPEIQHALAKVYTVLGKPDKALALLEQIHTKFPQLSDPAQDLAVAYLGKNQPDKAEKVLRNVIKVVPKDPASNLNLALALAKENKKKEALPHAKLAAIAADANIREQGERLVKLLT